MMMAVFLVGSMSAPLLAEEPLPLSISRISFEDYDRGPSGELIILDALIFRPLGVASMAVGAIGGILTGPWMLAAPCDTLFQSSADVQRELVCEPYQYTFERPLGYLENDRY